MVPFFKVVAYIGMHATPLLHGVKLFAASENVVPLIILAREEIRPLHDANWISLITFYRF